MPRYRVMIHGKNFLMDLDTGYKKTGFYAPRYADALDDSLAESTAIKNFKASEKYQEILDMSLITSDDCPELVGEDIEECHPNEDFDDGIEPGLVFYQETDD